MGNSITREQCVSIEEISEIKSHASYTVKRTSGLMDVGWTTETSEPAKWCRNMAHFDVKSSSWRIYMENGKPDPSEFAFGWRRLETIHPTEVTDIDEWRKKVLDRLEILENQRLNAHVTLEKKKSTAYVKEYTYDLFGHYSVVKTETCYEFTLVEPAGIDESWRGAIGKVTKVPLTEIMGVGEWEHVTPEKIF